MRAALLSMITIALMTPPAGALAQNDDDRSGAALAQPKQKAGAAAKRSDAQRRPRVSPSDLSDLAASMRASRIAPPADGSYRVYIPGRSPLYCLGVAGIVTCQ